MPANSTVDVLNNGEPIGTNKNLADIFSKIESGKPASDAIKETMQRQKQPEIAPAKTDAGIPTETKKELEESDLNKKLSQIQEKKEAPVEAAPADTREALLKKTEAKKEEETPTPVVPAEEVPEDELKVLPHDKPKTAKRIEALLKKNASALETVANTKKEIEAKQTRLAELEAQLKEVKPVDPATDAAVKAQLDELAMYRRQYGLEKDPEVKAKFDTRIESATKPIAEVLKRNGLTDDWLKLISDEGGWVKFAQSSKQVGLADGKKLSYAEIADTFLSNLPTMDKRAVELAVMEHLQVTRDKERYFEEEKGKAKEYFTNQEQEQQKRYQAQQEQVKQSVKLIDDWQKQTLQEDWLKEKAIPADASADQKRAIEEDNVYTKQLGQLLQQHLKTTELPKVLDMAKEAVKYYDERRKTASLTRELAQAKKELSEAKAQVDKIRSSVKSTPKSGSIATQKDSPSQTAQKAKPDSLEAAFDKLARGESLGGVITADNEE